MMPEMDGFEVCRRLRKDKQLAEVPIIILTALNSRQAVLEGINAGADDFITKPYNLVELRTRVETILRLNRYRTLLNERARFSWVVDDAEDGYVLVNAEDEVLYSNPRARLLFGLPETKTGEPGAKLLHQVKKNYLCEPGEAWFNWRSQTPQMSQQPRYLVRPETPDAHASWLRVTLLEQPTSEEPQWLLRFRDVTQQMSTQRDVWTFQRMVSHKLRTPLIGMSHGMQLLAKYAQKFTPEEVEEIARESFQNVEDLRKIIDDVVDFLSVPSAAKSGEGLIVRQMPALIQQTASDLAIATPTMSISPLLETFRFKLSSQAMEQILLEVLENSKKFHPTQAPQIELQLSPIEHRRARLQIIDNGSSIPPERQSMVWTPYYQGEKYFTGQVAGMGLGLPMVASIILETGGSCSIANRPDSPGVIVSLDIPLK